MSQRKLKKKWAARKRKELDIFDTPFIDPTPSFMARIKLLTNKGKKNDSGKNHR